MPDRRRSRSRGDFDWRSKHRRRSHAEAAGEPFEPVELPDHALISAESPQWIETDDALAELLVHARQTGLCCYDTEFIGESYYNPRLCLVQIATAQRVAVIDAMAGLSLMPVWELLADASVLKVVHAGHQDLEPVVRLLGRPPANVFDTQVAAGFVGLPYPLSLLRLVQTLLGVKLGKGLTFTSWDERPMSPAHVHYAADDVRFGPALHEALTQRLGVAGTTQWAMEQCAALCDPARYTPDLVQTAMKIKGATGLARAQAAVLFELVGLRDELAREHDVPPRSLMRDEVLLDIARRTPRALEKLDEVRGLPRPIKADYGARILHVVQQGLEKGSPPWPKRREHVEAPREQFDVDALWAVVQARCRARSVDPALVATRADVAAVYRAIARGGTQERAGDWRARLLDEIVRDSLAGQPVRLPWASTGTPADAAQ